IMASAKRPPFGRQHQTTQAFIACRGIQRLLQRRQYFLGQAVELVWPIECERKHTLVALAENELILSFHAVSLYTYDPAVWLHSQSSRPRRALRASPYA